MNEHQKRMTLSAAQANVMLEAVADSPPKVKATAERIAAGEVVPDPDADAVVDALSDAMLSRDGFDGADLTASGVRIDDIIGIVQQMSQHFYDAGSSGVI